VERLARAKARANWSGKAASSDRLILDLSGDLSAAKAERDRQLSAAGIARSQYHPDNIAKRQALEAARPAPEVRQAAASGVADFRAQFEAAKLAEAGKQQARQAFEQFKAEQQAQQRQAELAQEKAAQALAKSRKPSASNSPNASGVTMAPAGQDKGL
jgi:hypothetical protein